MSNGDLLSLSDAAKQYNLPVATLRTAIQRGYIRGQKVGNQWIVTRQVVEAYVTQRPRRGRPIKNRD